MQWTNESGGAYGEDPYGGAGYAYAYGHEYDGGATADTESLTRDPVTTAWDSPHGDVLTVPLPEADPSGPFPEANPSGLPVPGPTKPTRPSVRPVFVNSSGHRRRRVLRAARLLVIPAGGYVALLISSALGGPTISAPFVPQPHSTHPATPRATAPDSSPGTARSPEIGSPTAALKTPDPTAARTTSRPADRPTASATPAPAVAPASPASTPAVTPGPASKGRAIGSSHKPVKK
ncbi:hypothetical protein OG223_45450 [Streptomyces sp. NBC_01478]|uniref:hypothetical protein n=1 Tax=Streptomyces sp. NBC_01478 TaxID=2903882 RepID=UPI002E36BA25|nr:hypothetical protein [Streptomyces sp. NBC_01478]